MSETITAQPSIPLQALGPNGKAIAQLDSSSAAPIANPPPVVQPTRERMTKFRGAAAFVAWFTQGANDAVPGALLPYIEAQYQLDYAIVSLIFVANAIGFVVAAPLVQKLDHRFGRSKVLSAASICNAIAYAVIIAQPPFAAVAVMFAVLGFNFSLILSLNSSYVANVQNDGTWMGIMQGGYGLGGTLSPLIGTAMASNSIRWSFFYITTLTLCLTQAVLSGWAFKNFTPHHDRQPILTPPNTSPHAATAQANRSSKSALKQALRDRTTLLGAFFIFAYQGAEVTMSGWVVSFLIDYRHGDPARVGYVTAGFWAGITLGRFILCAPIHRLGARLCVPAIVAVWACLHVAIWLSKDIIGDAVTVGIIGFLTGPIAPIYTSVLSRLLDPRIQMMGISIGFSFGSGGAAVAPFITGLLAQRFGTVVLNPVAIVLCVLMQGSWFGLPFKTQWKHQ